MNRTSGANQRPLLRAVAAVLALGVAVALPPPALAQRSAGASRSAASTPPVGFTVSMPQPADHRFHVRMRVAGQRGPTVDLKMPAWHPGYYRLIDYAANVSNLRVTDGAGRAMPWQKTTKNTWRVVTGGATALVLDYDVLGTVRFSAQNYLDESRAFIAPTGMFMYVAGQLQRPSTVRLELPEGWTRVATGLDPVAVTGRARVFAAPDFDTLFDSPILIGTQETLVFTAGGKPHTVAIEDVPASVDRPTMIANLQRMVETAAALMGDMPYSHYAFLMMGQGAGGIEHATSSANHFNGASLTTEAGYRTWLSFITHEYFHHYNVKRIRPLALGPFDYDTENYTAMLWVSEGLSVYYQDLVLVRAGLLTPAQYLDKMAGAINAFENAAGHHYQSATDSSLTTWGTSGVGNDRNTTISYYNNGAMLGAMLDLAIRTGSANRQSLDDVMRSLYRTYYLGQRRGFTDDEFRQACEAAAGAPLAEVMAYAATTIDVDYAKYFALAGLDVTVSSEPAPGASLGLNLQMRDGRLIAAGATAGSAAATAGLIPGDHIVSVNGAAASPKVLNDVLVAGTPGDRIRLSVGRDGASRDIDVTLDTNRKRTFGIRAVPRPTALQSAILADWLRPVQQAAQR